MASCAVTSRPHPHPSPSTLPVTDLPAEVLRNIALHLDSHSSKHLAVTSRHCREPAEANVWRDILITDRDYLTAVLNDPLTTWDPDGSHEHHRHRASPGPASLSAGAITRSLIHFLGQAAWRAGLVRSLSFDLRFEFPAEIVELLERVSGGLKRLHLCSPSPNGSALPPSSLTSSLDLFRLVSSPLFALRHIRVEVQHDFAETVHSLLYLAPNVQMLHLHCHPRYLSNEDRLTPAPSRIPHLAKLTELIVDEMHDSLVSTLTDLVERARHLRRVALRDHTVRWHPSSSDPFFRALSQLDSLTTLETTSACLDAICESGGFGGLEELMMIWDMQTLEARQDGLVIPPLPFLRIYQLDVSSRDTRFRPDFNATSAMRILSSRLLPQISLVPALCQIICPSETNYSRRTGTVHISGPSWHSHDFQGVVVRQWRDQDRRHELLHCRTHVPVDKACSGADRSVSAPAWAEGALYNGEEVPVRILAAAYASAGINIDEVEPGRDMLLPQRGWDLLRYWEMMK